MISFNLTMLEDHFDKLEKRLKDLHKSESFVGYSDSQGIHEESGLKYTDLMKILSIGNSKNNLVARPIFSMAERNYDLSKSPLKKDLKKYFSEISKTSSPISTEKIHEHWVEDFSTDVLQLFGSTPPLEGNKQSTIDKKGFDAPLVNEGDLRDNLGYSINNSTIKPVKGL